ncbi:hypothetical protein CYMTET_31387 [Cymbomonas tetramitiformis]|uniref:Uncharacterized protein n=1 Tax=Cymbomonas tetramitiformis TaxID=36881 RepID=A0AAE0FH45_9CHLO|nr:hypothetical protein CYMTET_31387 [Cymbomonas tetramitiformis]
MMAAEKQRLKQEVQAMVAEQSAAQQQRLKQEVQETLAANTQTKENQQLHQDSETEAAYKHQSVLQKGAAARAKAQRQHLAQEAQAKLEVERLALQNDRQQLEREAEAQLQTGIRSLHQYAAAALEAEWTALQAESKKLVEEAAEHRLMASTEAGAQQSAGKQRLEQEQDAKAALEVERMRLERAGQAALEEERAVLRVERQRLQQEAQGRLQAEQQRLQQQAEAELQAERERLQAEMQNLEQQRLAQVAQVRGEQKRMQREAKEQQYLELEAPAPERRRLEQEAHAAAEEQHLAQKAMEQQRMEQEAQAVAEQQRLVDGVEVQRLALQKERQQLEREAETKLQTEMHSLHQEAATALDAQRAALQAEKQKWAQEQQRLEQEAEAELQAERERLQAEMQNLERAAEQQRLQQEAQAASAVQMAAEQQRLQQEAQVASAVQMAAEQQRLQQEAQVASAVQMAAAATPAAGGTGGSGAAEPAAQAQVTCEQQEPPAAGGAQAGEADAQMAVEQQRRNLGGTGRRWQQQPHLQQEAQAEEMAARQQRLQQEAQAEEMAARQQRLQQEAQAEEMAARQQRLQQEVQAQADEQMAADKHFPQQGTAAEAQMAADKQPSKQEAQAAVQAEQVRLQVEMQNLDGVAERQTTGDISLEQHADAESWVARRHTKNRQLQREIQLDQELSAAEMLQVELEERAMLQVDEGGSLTQLEYMEPQVVGREHQSQLQHVELQAHEVLRFEQQYLDRQADGESQDVYRTDVQLDLAAHPLTEAVSLSGGEEPLSTHMSAASSTEDVQRWALRSWHGHWMTQFQQRLSRKTMLEQLRREEGITAAQGAMSSMAHEEELQGVPDDTKCSRGWQRRRSRMQSRVMHHFPLDEDEQGNASDLLPTAQEAAVGSVEHAVCGRVEEAAVGSVEHAVCGRVEEAAVGSVEHAVCGRVEEAAVVSVEDVSLERVPPAGRWRRGVRVGHDARELAADQHVDATEDEVKVPAGAWRRGARVGHRTFGLAAEQRLDDEMEEEEEEEEQRQEVQKSPARSWRRGATAGQHEYEQGTEQDGNDGRVEAMQSLPAATAGQQVHEVAAVQLGDDSMVQEQVHEVAAVQLGDDSMVQEVQLPIAGSRTRAATAGQQVHEVAAVQLGDDSMVQEVQLPIAGSRMTGGVEHVSVASDSDILSGRHKDVTFVKTLDEIEAMDAEQVFPSRPEEWQQEQQSSPGTTLEEQGWLIARPLDDGDDEDDDSLAPEDDEVDEQTPHQQGEQADVQQSSVEQVYLQHQEFGPHQPDQLDPHQPDQLGKNELQSEFGEVANQLQEQPAKLMPHPGMQESQDAYDLQVQVQDLETWDSLLAQHRELPVGGAGSSVGEPRVRVPSSAPESVVGNEEGVLEQEVDTREPTSMLGTEALQDPHLGECVSPSELLQRRQEVIRRLKELQIQQQAWQERRQRQEGQNGSEEEEQETMSDGKEEEEEERLPVPYELESMQPTCLEEEGGMVLLSEIALYEKTEGGGTSPELAMQASHANVNPDEAFADQVDSAFMWEAAMHEELHVPVTEVDEQTAQGVGTVSMSDMGVDPPEPDHASSRLVSTSTADLHRPRVGRRQASTSTTDIDRAALPRSAATSTTDLPSLSFDSLSEGDPVETEADAISLHHSRQNLEQFVFGRDKETGFRVLDPPSTSSCHGDMRRLSLLEPGIAPLTGEGGEPPRELTEEPRQRTHPGASTDRKRRRKLRTPPRTSPNILSGACKVLGGAAQELQLQLGKAALSEHEVLPHLTPLGNCQRRTNPLPEAASWLHGVQPGFKSSGALQSELEAALQAVENLQAQLGTPELPNHSTAMRELEQERGDPPQSALQAIASIAAAAPSETKAEACKPGGIPLVVPTQGYEQSESSSGTQWLTHDLSSRPDANSQSSATLTATPRLLQPTKTALPPETYRPSSQDFPHDMRLESPSAQSGIPDPRSTASFAALAASATANEADNALRVPHESGVSWGIPLQVGYHSGSSRETEARVRGSSSQLDATGTGQQLVVPTNLDEVLQSLEQLKDTVQKFPGQISSSDTTGAGASNACEEMSTAVRLARELRDELKRTISAGAAPAHMVQPHPAHPTHHMAPEGLPAVPLLGADGHPMQSPPRHDVLPGQQQEDDEQEVQRAFLFGVMKYTADIAAASGHPIADVVVGPPDNPEGGPRKIYFSPSLDSSPSPTAALCSLPQASTPTHSSPDAHSERATCTWSEAASCEKDKAHQVPPPSRHIISQPHPSPAYSSIPHSAQELPRSAPQPHRTPHASQHILPYPPHTSPPLLRPSTQSKQEPRASLSSATRAVAPKQGGTLEHAGEWSTGKGDPAAQFYESSNLTARGASKQPSALSILLSVVRELQAPLQRAEVELREAQEPQQAMPEGWPDAPQGGPYDEEAAGLSTAVQRLLQVAGRRTAATSVALAGVCSDTGPSPQSASAMKSDESAREHQHYTPRPGVTPPKHEELGTYEDEELFANFMRTERSYSNWWPASPRGQGEEKLPEVLGQTAEVQDARPTGAETSPRKGDGQQHPEKEEQEQEEEEIDLSLFLQKPRSSSIMFDEHGAGGRGMGEPMVVQPGAASGSQASLHIHAPLHRAHQDKVHRSEKGAPYFDLGKLNELQKLAEATADVRLDSSSSSFLWEDEADAATKAAVQAAVQAGVDAKTVLQESHLAGGNASTQRRGPASTQRHGSAARKQPQKWYEVFKAPQEEAAPTPRRTPRNNRFTIRGPGLAASVAFSADTVGQVLLGWAAVVRSRSKSKQWALERWHSKSLRQRTVVMAIWRRHATRSRKVKVYMVQVMARGREGRLQRGFAGWMEQWRWLRRGRFAMIRARAIACRHHLRPALRQWIQWTSASIAATALKAEVEASSSTTPRSPDEGPHPTSGLPWALNLLRSSPSSQHSTSDDEILESLTMKSQDTGGGLSTDHRRRRRYVQGGIPEERRRPESGLLRHQQSTGASWEAGVRRDSAVMQSDSLEQKAMKSQHTGSAVSTDQRKHSDSARRSQGRKQRSASPSWKGDVQVGSSGVLHTPSWHGGALSPTECGSPQHIENDSGQEIEITPMGTGAQGGTVEQQPRDCQEKDADQVAEVSTKQHGNTISKEEATGAQSVGAWRKQGGILASDEHESEGKCKQQPASNPDIHSKQHIDEENEGHVQTQPVGTRDIQTLASKQHGGYGDDNSDSDLEKTQVPSAGSRKRAATVGQQARDLTAEHLNADSKVEGRISVRPTGYRRRAATVGQGAELQVDENIAEEALVLPTSTRQQRVPVRHQSRELAAEQQIDDNDDQENEEVQVPPAGSRNRTATMGRELTRDEVSRKHVQVIPVISQKQPAAVVAEQRSDDDIMEEVQAPPAGSRRRVATVGQQARELAIKQHSDDESMVEVQVLPAGSRRRAATVGQQAHELATKQHSDDESAEQVQAAPAGTRRRAATVGQQARELVVKQRSDDDESTEDVKEQEAGGHSRQQARELATKQHSDDESAEQVQVLPAGSRRRVATVGQQARELATKQHSNDESTEEVKMLSPGTRRRAVTVGEQVCARSMVRRRHDEQHSDNEDAWEEEAKVLPAGSRRRAVLVGQQTRKQACEPAAKQHRGDDGDGTEESVPPAVSIRRGAQRAHGLISDDDVEVDEDVHRTGTRRNTAAMGQANRKLGSKQHGDGNRDDGVQMRLAGTQKKVAAVERAGELVRGQYASSTSEEEQYGQQAIEIQQFQPLKVQKMMMTHPAAARDMQRRAREWPQQVAGQPLSQDDSELTDSNLEDFQENSGAMTGPSKQTLSERAHPWKFEWVQAQQDWGQQPWDMRGLQAGRADLEMPSAMFEGSLSTSSQDDIVATRQVPLARASREDWMDDGDDNSESTLLCRSGTEEDKEKEEDLRAMQASRHIQELQNEVLEPWTRSEPRRRAVTEGESARERQEREKQKVHQLASERRQLQKELRQQREQEQERELRRCQIEQSGEQVRSQVSKARLERFISRNRATIMSSVLGAWSIVARRRRILSRLLLRADTRRQRRTLSRVAQEWQALASLRMGRARRMTRAIGWHKSRRLGLAWDVWLSHKTESARSRAVHWRMTAKHWGELLHRSFQGWREHIHSSPAAGASTPPAATAVAMDEDDLLWASAMPPSRAPPSMDSPHHSYAIPQHPPDYTGAQAPTPSGVTGLTGTGWPGAVTMLARAVASSAPSSLPLPSPTSASARNPLSVPARQQRGSKQRTQPARWCEEQGDVQIAGGARPQVKQETPKPVTEACHREDRARGSAHAEVSQTECISGKSPSGKIHAGGKHQARHQHLAVGKDESSSDDENWNALKATPLTAEHTLLQHSMHTWKAHVHMAVEDGWEELSDAVLKELRYARDCVRRITKSQLEMLRGMPSPPLPVKMVLEAVCLMINDEKPATWKVVRHTARQQDFIHRILRYDPEGMSPELLKQLVETYLVDSNFSIKNVMRASSACTPLARWVISQAQFRGHSLRSAWLRRSRTRTRGWSMVNQECGPVPPVYCEDKSQPLQYDYIDRSHAVNFRHSHAVWGSGAASRRVGGEKTAYLPASAHPTHLHSPPESSKYLPYFPHSVGP